MTMRSNEANMLLWCGRFAEALVPQIEEAIAAGPEGTAGALDAFDRISEALPVYTDHLLRTLDRARELIGEPKVWTPGSLDAATEARMDAAMEGRIRLALSRRPKEA